MVQLLKLPAGKVGVRGFVLRSVLQVSKKQNVLPRSLIKIQYCWRASVTERQRARPQTARAQILNPVSEGQCYLINLTILKRFSWPSLAYMCTNMA